MKSIIAITAVLLLSIAAGCANDVVLDADSFENDVGKADFIYSISEAQFEKQPSWAPGKQPVPIAIDKAIQAAQTWTAKQTWAKKAGDITEITLENNQDMADSQNNSHVCWFYSVHFSGHESLAHANPRTVFPGRVIVLLDGSIVGPRLRQPGDPKLPF